MKGKDDLLEVYQMRSGVLFIQPVGNEGIYPLLDLYHTYNDAGIPVGSRGDAGDLDGGIALCPTHCLTRCARQYDEHWPMRHMA